MNKTEAAKIARQKLGSGHYVLDHQTTWVQYGDHKVYMYGPTRRPTHGEMVKQLTTAILDIEAGLWETIEA